MTVTLSKVASEASASGISGPVSPSRRRGIIGCVAGATAILAAESTIVATAMPTIVHALSGASLFVWVFSGFALMQTALSAIFGRATDMVGRRPVILVGLAIFMAGSAVAGLAANMPVLIFGRLLQGAGTGAIRPVCLTIIADLYPVRERGRIQGWLASIWAAAAIAGPLFGGWIIAAFGWRWLFWLNVPIAIGTMAAFRLLLLPGQQIAGRKLDLPGATFFVFAVGSLLVALTDLRSASATRLWISLSASLLFGAIFIRREASLIHTLLPLAELRQRVILAANGTAFVTGIVLIGATTFLPLYVQTVLGRSVAVAGLTLTMVMVGWPIGATIAARAFPRIALETILVGGCVLLPIGATLLLFLEPTGGPLPGAAGCFVMGVGMGLSSISSLVLVQERAPEERRASVTASNIFARNLGSTIGAAILGAVHSYAARGAPVGGSGSQNAFHQTFIAILLLSCMSVGFGMNVFRRLDREPVA